MTAPVEQWRRIAPDYFAHCWNSVDRPHRQPILDAVASLMPAASLLEIGCNAGPNLRLIHERWPEVGLYGLDANVAAVTYCGERLRMTAIEGDVRRWAPTLADKAFDVVLTSYCLAYIEAEEITNVLAHLVRIARVGLVIAEPMVFSGGSQPYPAGIQEWAHNYIERFPDATTAVALVDPPVERLNAVLTVRR